MQLDKDRSLYYYIYVHFYYGYERSFIDNHTDISTPEEVFNSEGCLLKIEI